VADHRTFEVARRGKSSNLLRDRLRIENALRAIDYTTFPLTNLIVLSAVCARLAS